MPSGQPPQGSAATPAALRPPFAPATRGVVIASYVLMGAALLLVMLRGLLPGLLCVCLGFLLTRWLAPRLAWLPSRTANSMATRGQTAAATLVMLSPLVLLALALSHSRTYIVDAPQQYRELLDFLARTVLELRLKLPTDIAAQLPEGAAEIQRTIAAYLAAKAGALAMAGRAWLTGLLYAYVGLLIGALAAVRSVGASRGPWHKSWCCASRVWERPSARSSRRSSGLPPSTRCSPPCSCCWCCPCGTWTCPTPPL